MTAYAMKGDRERCLESGMDGYVSKPIQPRELWEMIDKLVPNSSPAPVAPLKEQRKGRGYRASSNGTRFEKTSAAT